MGLDTERTKASWDWKHRLLNGIAFSNGEIGLPSDVGDHLQPRSPTKLYTSVS